MIDDTDAMFLSEAFEHARKCIGMLESIVTDDDKLNDTYDRLEAAAHEMETLLDAYEHERTKDWDTPLGDY